MTKISVAVLGLFVLIYIFPLGVRPLTIPDETRYAEIPREMIATGDWVVPYLNGLRYFEKPVLGYWLNAAAMRVFGENAFAVRFPSALAAGISALAVLFLVRNFGGGPAVGIFSAAVFLSCVQVFAVGVFAVLDTVFAMLVTVCMMFLFHAVQETNPGTRRKWLGMAGAFCGLGFLVKGPLGFVLPVIVFVPFLLWQRRWKDVVVMPWVPLAVTLAVILPWAVTIHLREGDFWRYFVWTEHIERFLSATGHQQHPRPFWFFVPVLAAGFIPWTFVLGAAARGLRREASEKTLVRFCLCWLVIPFVFFSMSKGKLGTYILPCFAPLAVLTGMGISSYLGSGRRKAFDGGAVVSAVAVGVLGVVLVLSQTTALPGFRFYSADETWKWVLGAVALVCWCAGAVFAKLVSAPDRKMALYCLSPLAFLLCAHFIIPDSVHADRVIPERLITSNLDRIRSDTIVVADSDESPAVCWLLKRNDVYVFNDGGELSYGLRYSDATNRLLTVEGFGNVVRENRGKRNVVLIEEERDYDRRKATLPAPSFEDAVEGFVFVEYKSR